MKKLDMIDPRTVARDIPGFFEVVFPGLTPGLVAHFNATARSVKYETVTDEQVRRSSLNPALLFEVACVRTDKLIKHSPDADVARLCLDEAWTRQSKFYDSRYVESIGDEDWGLARIVSSSLYGMLRELSQEDADGIVIRPPIRGCQWIASSAGDYSIGECLIEVKCSSGNFSGADYRQVLMYWILSLIADMEGRGRAWSNAVLVNPRRGLVVDLDIPSFLPIVGRGATNVEMMQRFLAAIGERSRG